MIRAFIAIDIPDDVRAAIGEAQARLKRAHVGREDLVDEN